MEAGDVDYYGRHQTYSQLREQVMLEELPEGSKATVDTLRRMVHQHFSDTEGLTAIDIGCGSGYLLHELKCQGFRCLATDFNPEMIRIAQDIYGLEGRVASPLDLEKEQLKFNVAILSQVLEHVAEPVTFLKSIRNLLTPEGLLFVVVPNRNFIRVRKGMVRGNLPEANYPPHHVTFWSNRSLDAILWKADLKLIDCYAQTYPDSHTAERSLMNNHNYPLLIARFIARTASLLGKMLRLPGVNVFAIAQRTRT